MRLIFATRHDKVQCMVSLFIICSLYGFRCSILARFLFSGSRINSAVSFHLRYPAVQTSKILKTPNVRFGAFRRPIKKPSTNSEPPFDRRPLVLPTSFPTNNRESFLTCAYCTRCSQVSPSYAYRFVPADRRCFVFSQGVFVTVKGCFEGYFSRIIS